MCGNVSKSRFIFYLSPIKLLSDLPHYAKMYHTGAYQVNTKFFKIKGKKLLDSTSHMLGNSDKSELRIARGILQMRTKGVLPEFQEFLLSHKLASEKHVLFLAIWAGKFLAFSNRNGSAQVP